MTKVRTTEKAPDGSLSTHNGFSLISNEKLLEIYSTMLKCRMLEERIHALSKRQKRCEDAPALRCILRLLRARLLICCRRHARAVAGSVDSVLCQRHAAWRQSFRLSCREAALLPGRGIRPEVIPPSFSSGKQLERALAAAAFCKAKRNKKVVIVFLSDASGASQ